jgi:hypothetical protein
MEILYLVGEPLFKPEEPREKFDAPFSQVELCHRVLMEVQNPQTILRHLREEYLAIVGSLKAMGIDFRIVYSHPTEVDKGLLTLCIQRLGCRLTGFDSKYRHSAVIYPRDFATVLPGLVLVNSRAVRIMINKREDYRIVASPYGEGGRVLVCGNTMLIGERLLLEDGRLLEPAGLEEIKQMGIRIGLLPLPACTTVSINGISTKFSFNDHLDRVACLLQGKDGGLHLVVDPQIHSVNWKGLCSPKETLERIESTCKPLGIMVHCPKKLEVPYSINLVQFPDGRVLMTSGDEAVAEVVMEIIGEEKAFGTPIPIRFLPVWAYAGIRCFTNGLPKTLFIPKASA